MKTLQRYYPRVSDPSKNESDVAKPGRFSLHNLSAAFARLTGVSESKSSMSTSMSTSTSTSTTDVAEALGEQQAEAESIGSEVLSPRMIVEGMLFVGNNEGRPLSSREMAAHIRDVSPREVETLIDELNELYTQTLTSYRIVSEGKGYRLALGPQFDAVRQRFQGPST